MSTCEMESLQHLANVAWSARRMSVIVARGMQAVASLGIYLAVSVVMSIIDDESLWLNMLRFWPVLVLPLLFITLRWWNDVSRRSKNAFYGAFVALFGNSPSGAIQPDREVRQAIGRVHVMRMAFKARARLWGLGVLFLSSEVVEFARGESEQIARLQALMRKGPDYRRAMERVLNGTNFTPKERGWFRDLVTGQTEA